MKAKQGPKEKAQAAEDLIKRRGDGDDFDRCAEPARLALFWGSRRKQIAAVFTVLALIVLLASLYLLCTRIIFLANAESSETPIVGVIHEYVPKGRASVLAYVPMVEVRGAQGRLQRVKVSTFNEAPVYVVGQKMRVICHPKRGCIEDTFLAKWGDALIDLLISLVLFVPLLYYRLVPDDPDPITKLLDR
jgi:hypothetical protein